MKLLIISEFKQNFKSFLVWTAIIIGMTTMMLSVFSVFGDTLDNFADVMEMYPEEFTTMFGLGPGGLDMTNLYGWFGVEVYLFVTILGGTYAAILGSSILSKEEDDKTIEFLLSRPISRSKILLGKAIAALINIIILNTTYGICILILFTLLGELDVTTWLLLIVGPLLQQTIFVSISLMISTFITKARQVMSISIGLVLGLYALDLISNVSKNFEFIKYISPFEYIDAGMIINDNVIKIEYLLISLGVITISSFITWFIYSKKDITT